ncbi:hypothetical protein Tco_0404827 [Tanacetum coccineum]
MIRSLMYLIASRPDIMFAVYAYARFHVTPKTSHLLAVKRIFRYLKGKPTLGLWYSRDSPFELVAYTDSDYAGATQDRKPTTGGCQFLGNRLISWQCKKQTVVATSTTKAEYVVAASCYGQVLWIQNQLLDYVYNFMNTMIRIDNKNTICIIENPVQHSKTKHIQIRHHFIRDCNAKKLIQMVKIDTEHNVANLLIKGFDAGRHVKRGRDTKIPQFSGPPVKVGDEAVHKELGDKMERAATTASSLEAEQDSGSGLRCQDTILGGVDAQTRKVKITVSEASIRRHLKLEDSKGIPSLPTAEIFEQLALMGVPSTSQPPITLIEEAAPMPYESPLHSVHLLRHDEGSMQQNELMDLVTKLSERVTVLETDIQQTKKVYSSAITKLILRVKKLEKTVKTTKARRRARVVLSEDEDGAEDSSKQGKKISDIDIDPIISLVQPQQDIEYDFDATVSIHVTTASASISTVSPLRVSAAEDISGAEILVYIRRSTSKAKDKGKAIMQESVPSKKSRKGGLLVHMSVKALELLKQLDEREEVAAKVDQAHDIDWSDPAILRYHTLQNRPFSIAEVRKNMCMYLKNQGGYKMSHFKGTSYEDIRLLFKRVWDQNQAFVPKDYEIEKEVMKRSGFNLQQESISKDEALSFVHKQPARGRRKKSHARKRARETLSEENAKKQKLEDDTEKEELQVYLNIVPKDKSLDIKSLATKLVKERFQIASPEGYDLLLWGDLKTLIEPNEEDEIWRNQQDWNLIN